MNPQLKDINIVVLAKNHNPSIVSKEWLLQKKILEGNVINFAHTAIFSLVETDTFKIFVDPDRLQFSTKNFTEDDIVKLSKMTEQYLNSLPETPYTAIGFNFIFQPEILNLKNIFTPNDKILKKILSEKYHIDGIIKFDFENFNSSFMLQQMQDGKIQANFNYNFSSNELEKIKQKLNDYSRVEKKSEQILKELFNA